MAEGWGVTVGLISLGGRDVCFSLSGDVVIVLALFFTGLGAGSITG